MVRHHKEQMKAPVISKTQVRETSQKTISTMWEDRKGGSSGVKWRPQEGSDPTGHCQDACRCYRQRIRVTCPAITILSRIVYTAIPKQTMTWGHDDSVCCHSLKISDWKHSPVFSPSWGPLNAPVGQIWLRLHPVTSWGPHGLCSFGVKSLNHKDSFLPLPYFCICSQGQ